MSDPSIGPDTNVGTSTFIGTWILTAFTGIVLLFRFAVKGWVYIKLPKVSAPERIWGFEDVLFVISYCIDVVHMSFLQISYSYGLGRHFVYLDTVQKLNSMKWQIMSQPFAVLACTVSRTGMMWFLYQCFGKNNRRFRPLLIFIIIVHTIINIAMILEIVLQCGPNPYRASERLAYFHLMWDGVPADGSAVCLDLDIEVWLGYAQGVVNTLADFVIFYIATLEIWQLFFSDAAHSQVGFWQTFKAQNPTTRNRRIWQTVTLSGPVLLSGVASIIKTSLLGSIGNRGDFTHNVVSFMLWVKIEDYSILIACCAPVLRTFLKFAVDLRGGSSQRSTYTLNSNSVPLTTISQKRTRKLGFDRMESDSTEDLQEKGSPQTTIKTKEEIDIENGGLRIMVTHKVVVSSAEADDQCRERRTKDKVLGWEQKSNFISVNKDTSY